MERQSQCASFLFENYPNRFVHDAIIPNQEGCKFRPDFRLETDDTNLIVEVDEYSHFGYDLVQEKDRMIQLASIDGKESTVFIRFNPDRQINNGTISKVGIVERLESLKSEIDHWLTFDAMSGCKVVYLFYKNKPIRVEVDLPIPKPSTTTTTTTTSTSSTSTTTTTPKTTSSKTTSSKTPTPKTTTPKTTSSKTSTPKTTTPKTSTPKTTSSKTTSSKSTTPKTTTPKTPTPKTSMMTSTSTTTTTSMKTTPKKSTSTTTPMKNSTSSKTSSSSDNKRKQSNQSGQPLKKSKTTEPIIIDDDDINDAMFYSPTFKRYESVSFYANLLSALKKKSYIGSPNHLNHYQY
ncbi:hypothetical protein SAMD00019534_040000 [Acytostelium subglobosum LB1]|uniref:hypothetical protein n=1 Tax=Acytostelium subglobosum LB1 TaxID=1410327 RepID=UPI0006450189|nr:hypothetical protein SAMD00019534_040000 [Acytostelium subglobosum LB1]GAM20825.1 hypothetical protein SAMD00019534_040000 [Acytostelium subglobosum LB1]|eukprot:XP_012755959.1 hypothetical protein SAMD00019534_040000 [Acytostelium subglobosum LB1]